MPSTTTYAEPHSGSRRDLGAGEVLNRLPIGFLAVDRAGAVLVANPAAHHLLAWPAERSGVLPDALRVFLDPAQSPECMSPGCVGLCFARGSDRWCEGWVTRSSLAGEMCFWIVLRSVDEERKLSLESQARWSRLFLVSEITTALNSALGLEETFNVILVGVTAGQGLGFNRAFLFLADEKEEWLTGSTAIGPASPAQAEAIWKALAPAGAGGLTEAVCTYRMVLDGHDAEVNRRVRATRIPKGGLDNPFADVIRGSPARVIRSQDSANPDVLDVFASLDAHELACAPLRSRDKVVGLLLADHRITGNPITLESLHALELLACQAGLAVGRAALADKLSRRVEQLRQAHEKIEGIQELVARLERYSVVGEITAEVAHQLRNPLTIIGGFARNMLSAKTPQDVDYRGLTVIANQADRVCRILDRIISVEGWEGRPRQIFALEPVLRQSLEVMETRLADRKINWSLTCKLDGFALSGRPDALRFALFKILSGIVEDLGAGAEVTVTAERTTAGSQVVVGPRSADNENTRAKAGIINIFQGKWGMGQAQRNLALEYLTEHRGALGMITLEDGRPALVIEFAAEKEEAHEDRAGYR